MQTPHFVKCVVAAVTLSANSLGAQATVTPILSPLPAASSVKAAAEAGNVLRQLYFLLDYNDGTALGDSLVRRFPRDSRLRAWYVANVAASRTGIRADSLTARIDTTSHDPWLIAALAIAKANSPNPSKIANAEAQRLMRRARTLAPREPDFIQLLATFKAGVGPYAGNPADAVAFVDSAGPKAGNSLELQLIRAGALLALATPRPTSPSQQPVVDTVQRAEALGIFANAARDNPSSFRAQYEMALRLRLTSADSAVMYMRRAVSLDPRAPNVRLSLWSLINSRRIPTAERRAEVARDRDDFLAVTDSAPWAMAAAIAGMRIAARDADVTPLEERILARAPRSSFAEDVLLNRANQWRDSLFAARDTARPGLKSESTVVRRRFIAATEDFIAKPWVANPLTRDQAVLNLFFEVREDTAYPGPKLVTLVKQLIAARMGGAPSFRYGESARALANRKLEPALAEQLVREGLKGTTKYLDDFPGYTFSSAGDKEETLDGQNATLYDNLGWVFFGAGRFADADREISRALDLSKKNASIYYDLGRLRMAQGREEEAELVFAQGMTIRMRGVNPNRAELQRLYEKEHASIGDWESYIASLEEKERTTRKAKILATRDATPKSMPRFKLTDLAGRPIDSDSVQSQYLLVHFWGTWCGPCVAEMPEFQQFYDKYRNDKTITVVTISNDKDLKDLREWMASRKLTIPTLFDDGYVAKLAHVNAFPTTWFIDRDGKLVYRAVGNTGALVEEFTWRLDALRAGPVIQP